MLGKEGEQVKKLNAGGDDLNLAEHGGDRRYWYSIKDIMVLLINMRRAMLQYDDEQEIAAGEEYIAIRQNQEGVFLADPHHSANFADCLHDDISRIIGGHETLIQNNYAWQVNMPTRIIIPLLSGMHWRTVIIQINYGDNNVYVMWDDPYGTFPDQLKDDLLRPITTNVLRLLNRNAQMGGDEGVTELTRLDINISQDNNIIDQQGQDGNGWDCGPITVSNIGDYIRNDWTAVDYTIGQCDEEGHEKAIQNTRAAHIVQYSDVAEIPVDEGRLNNIRSVWELDAKSRLESIDARFNRIISKLDVFYLNMFFTVLENYRQFHEEVNVETVAKYALDFVIQAKKNKIGNEEDKDIERCSISDNPF